MLHPAAAELPQVLALFVGGACCYSDGFIVTVDEPVAPGVVSGRSVCEAARRNQRRIHLRRHTGSLIRAVLLGNSLGPSLFPGSF